MDKMNIAIPINKKRVPHLFIISCSMLVFIIYDAYNKLKTSSFEAHNNWSLIFLIPLLYFAAISFIDYCKTLFDRNASLIISDLAIVDNLSIFSCGEIPLSDITDVQLKTTFFAEFLIIKLRDPLKHLKNKNFVQGNVLKQYIKKFGSPIVISDQRVQHNLLELKRLIVGRMSNS